MEPDIRDTADKALFISRAGADADFATVIGTILEGAGYTITLQQWDFANRNFMERIHAALADGARVVALLSPEYLRSEHCQAEWQNAIADDPLNTKSRLILLRVAECEPVGLLRGLAYWDLVPIRDNRALLEQAVRGAVRQDRIDAGIGPYWREPRTIVDSDAIRPVPSFSGREKELAALSAALASDGAIVAVHGLGGVGKSSVAREYAWRARHDYSVIWWLNAQTEDGIIEGLLRLSALLTRGLDQLADRRAAAQQVTNSLLCGFSKPVLLIFDNLEEERLLQRWRPRSGSRLLATSRNTTWGPDVSAIALDTWPLETAISYLLRESTRDLTGADAQAIAQTLGALPLALSHAAASLRTMRMVTPQRYLERIGEHLNDAPPGVEYPNSIFATFSASIAQAEHQAAGAAALLCFAALFAPDAIPEELFHQSIELCPDKLQPVMHGDTPLDLRPALADDFRLDAALATLDRLALLTFAQGSRTYSMHRLVQLAAADIGGANAPGWNEYAVAVAEAAFPSVELVTWPECERLLPHAEAALDGLPIDSGLLAAANLAHRCADYLRERGKYDASVRLETRSLAIRERVLGTSHPDVASSVSNLAVLSRHQGRYEDAVSLHARALAIREKLLGPEDADVAHTLNNLAIAYWDQGRFSEAESVFARALAIWERAFGPDDPRVATVLLNLANVYDDLGRYDETVTLLKRALAIWERALGPDHPDVAMSLNNLAITRRKQARLEEAVILHNRALAIRERVLGPDHPEVGMSLNNLGIVYHDQKRYAEAEPLYRRAISISEKAVGPDHELLAENLNNLGNLYRELGRYAESEELLGRALAIREHALGRSHPKVAESLSDLAELCRVRGHFDQAKPLLTRALAIREGALGVDHPDTKLTREALGAHRSTR